MQKVFGIAKRYSDSIYLIFIAFSWLISFYIIESNLITSLIWIGIFIYHLFFVAKKEKLLYLILLLPFKYANRFDINSMPLDLILIGILCPIAMIIYFIINKVKIKKGKFFNGFIAVCAALLLGGIFTNYFSFVDFILIFAILLLVIIIYLILTSIINEVNFDYLTKIIFYLGILIVGEFSIYYIFSSPDILNKQIFLGWGLTNNIALILIGVLPFTFYKIMKSNVKNILFNTIAFILQIIVLFLTFSRGSIFVFIIIEVPIFIILSFKIKEKKIFYLTFASCVCLGLIMFLIIYLQYNSIFEKMVKTWLGINLNSLNGRNSLFADTWNYFKQYPVFGIGVFGGFHWDTEVEGYIWAHGTLFHTMLTMGSVGVMALACHMGEKYFYLFQKINYKKVIILLALFATDMYGFFDVSYYYPVYMVFLVIILIGIEDIVKSEVGNSNNDIEQLEINCEDL